MTERPTAGSSSILEDRIRILQDELPQSQVPQEAHEKVADLIELNRRAAAEICRKLRITVNEMFNMRIIPDGELIELNTAADLASYFKIPVFIGLTRVGEDSLNTSGNHAVLILTQPVRDSTGQFEMLVYDPILGQERTKKIPNLPFLKQHQTWVLDKKGGHHSLTELCAPNGIAVCMANGPAQELLDKGAYDLSLLRDEKLAAGLPERLRAKQTRVQFDDYNCTLMCLIAAAYRAGILGLWSEEDRDRFAQKTGVPILLRQEVPVLQEPEITVHSSITLMNQSPDRKMLSQIEIGPESSEWQPKKRPGDLVFEYFEKIITQGQIPPKDALIMLSAWLGSPDQKTKLLVIEVLEKYGPLQEDEKMIADYGGAVFSFVAGRIRKGTVTAAELELLSPWLDCPKPSGHKNKEGKEMTLAELVKRAIEAGKKVIATKKQKEQEPLPFSVDYAGVTSAGGRENDEDAIFLPGQFIPAEINNKKEEKKKIDDLAHYLCVLEKEKPDDIITDRQREQRIKEIEALPAKIKEMIEKGKFAGLYIVADGVGGHNFGSIASSLAVYSAVSFLAEQIDQGKPIDQNLVSAAIQKANEKTYQYNNRPVDGREIKRSRKNMAATTIVLAIIDRNKTAFIGNIGDSRAYCLYSDQFIQRITTDHSQVEELVREGEISPKDVYTHPFNNIVTQVLGIDPTVTPDIYKKKLNPEDTLILCCDGVWEGFPPSEEQTDQQVHENFRKAVINKTPQEIAETLTRPDVGKKSKDNTSAVIVKISRI